MKDEYEGKNLEEAIGRASADLSIPEAELHYEVLEQGRKGLLGLGMKNVRIRVMRPVEHLTDREILNGEEPAGARVEAVAEVPPAGDSARESASGEGARSGRPRRRRRSGRSRKPSNAATQAAGSSEAGQAAEAAVGEGGAAAGSAEGSPSGEESRSGKPRRRRRSRKGGRSRNTGRQAQSGGAEELGDDPGFEEVDDTPVEPLTGQPLEVQQTLEKIFELSDLQIEVQPGIAESGMALRLGGADRKLLRQRNAELLLALQLLLNRMARRAWPEVGRIHLSTNGDNKSRDSKLVELTHGAAEEVSKTGRTKKLRPMNAYERRLVHLTIREYTGLTSSSDGKGAVKRVRISKVQNTINV